MEEGHQIVFTEMNTFKNRKFSLARDKIFFFSKLFIVWFDQSQVWEKSKKKIMHFILFNTNLWNIFTLLSFLNN